MLTKEQEQAIKYKIKTNRRLRSLFFQIARISLKPDIFESLIQKGYELFGIEYSVKEILYKKESEAGLFYQQMYIGYFDMTCIGEQTYEFQKQELENFYYQIIYGILDKKCIEKSLSVKSILKDEFMGQTFDFWIKNFSKEIVGILFQKMFVYYSKIVKIFNDSFEKKDSKRYLLKEGSDYFTNDHKNKLFQELKYSQAKKYYISGLNKSIKEDFKETIIDKYQNYFEKTQTNLENLILNN